MKRDEAKLQAAVINWWRLRHRYFGLPEFALLHIPNGGRRDKVTAAILKGQGVRAGIPDLFLAVPRGDKHGLFIEMKAPKGKASDQQEEVLAYLCTRGYSTAICRSSLCAITLIDEYLTTKQ